MLHESGSTSLRPHSHWQPNPAWMAAATHELCNSVASLAYWAYRLLLHCTSTSWGSQALDAQLIYAIPLDENGSRGFCTGRLVSEARALTSLASETKRPEQNSRDLVSFLFLILYHRIYNHLDPMFATTLPSGKIEKKENEKRHTRQQKLDSIYVILTYTMYRNHIVTGETNYGCVPFWLNRISYCITATRVMQCSVGWLAC